MTRRAVHGQGDVHAPMRGPLMADGVLAERDGTQVFSA
jgi:hypothetical protein